MVLEGSLFDGGAGGAFHDEVADVAVCEEHFVDRAAAVGAVVA